MDRYPSPLLAVLLSAVLCPLPAADWPRWAGTPSGNMVSPEVNLPDGFVPGSKLTQGEGIDLATTKNVAWAARTGAFSCGTPSVAHGRVFLGAMIDQRGVMKCFDEVTGTLLWQWTRPCRGDLKADAMNFRNFPKSLGVCSSATVDGDRLYFVDQNCVVQCLAADTGKEVWSFDMFADPAVGSRPSDACNGSPLIDGDLLYVTTSNGVDRIVTVPIAEDAARRCFAPHAPTLIVLDKRTGRFLAKDTAPTAANMLHGQWSSPTMGVVGGRTLIFLGGGDGRCYAFEALAGVPEKPTTLATVWWADCNPPEYRAFNGMDMIVHYTLGDKRRRDSINKLNDGSFVGMSEIIATPVFLKDRIYVAIGRDPDHGRGRGALWCLDAKGSGDITTTNKIWCYQGMDRTLSTVSIADGLLYIADVGGRLHCLEVDSGKPLWVFETKGRTIASTLVADGKVYLPTEKFLNILSAGRELKLLSQIQLGAPSWATPVAANGRLFISSRNYLWAVKRTP